MASDGESEPCAGTRGVEGTIQFVCCLRDGLGCNGTGLDMHVYFCFVDTRLLASIKRKSIDDRCICLLCCFLEV